VEKTAQCRKREACCDEHLIDGVADNIGWPVALLPDVSLRSL